MIPINRIEVPARYRIEKTPCALHRVRKLMNWLKATAAIRRCKGGKAGPPREGIFTNHNLRITRIMPGLARIASAWEAP
jgi:hypothetical protein